MSIIDISMRLSSTTACWPGDTPFDYEASLIKSESGVVHVGKIEISTYLDAPFHFVEQVEKVHEMPLDCCISKAVVINCTAKDEIGEEDVIPHLNQEDITSVLLKICHWDHCQPIPSSIPLIRNTLPLRLAEFGISLIGVGLPSVDAIDSINLPIQRALYKNGIWILEGIVLDHVNLGIYNSLSFRSWLTEQMEILYELS
ncbi:cyclase family protein [Jeotgalibacillus soli]|uniref:Uncharacterized protein n=1 Tax=Jeotgalibacillus soli TaxID=889306 RepID=A0A0C2VQR2_9BACL|nr:cyclase family protein [Jeotgalibacillus soli]KIL46791.1 hypothetical protein KP78_19090 [Jeotgalibacillus soli]